MYSIVGLVFLGLVPLTEPDWGVMIYMGRQQGVLFMPQAVRDAAVADYRDCPVPTVAGAVLAFTGRNL